jgi:hypothetical protein
MPLQASTVQFGDGVDHYKVTPLASERAVLALTLRRRDNTLLKARYEKCSAQ